ncbi:MAG: flagellar basal body rod protein FlgB [Rhodospirillaceae bacterium]|nr:flagellar basal body rod protein FlgB [Rhodospirillaceae bacterium]
MLEDLSLFSMANKTLNWLAKRQTVLAENVANANTPSYKAKDVAPLDFKSTLARTNAPAAAVTTNPMHIEATIAQPMRTDIVAERRPQESTPNGNSVLIEDQMEKIGQVKSRYEMTLNLFQKNLSMIKISLGKGGGS